jgi:undecaprenyl-diphosphatase
LIGVNLTLYQVTDWLGLVPIAVALGFAAYGLCEWIRLRSIARVDKSLLLLGAFYAVTAAAYAFFEVVVINYRPVLIDGFLEASYPSSTTLLVSCVMPTAMLQIRLRIKSKPLMLTVNGIMAAFCIFMVVGRLFSGVHWLSDIVGGLLLSGALVCAYRYFERKC